jgi:hypothetical protein
MSLVFSDTTNKDGIIQKLEQVLFGDNGDARISGNSFLLAKFTGDVNLALDKAFSIIFQADGRWQFDDRNHTDYPIIYTNIVSGQKDYPFTVDANSNLILEIQKVAILPNASATVYEEIKPTDAQSEDYSPLVAADSNNTGTPYAYDKLANSIFLDPEPDYNATNGLKVYISREGNYFTTADTTQMPGFAGLFHEYCVLRPAWQYAYANNLANAPALREEMIMMEKEMEKYYGKREQDEKHVMKPKKILYI